MDVNKLFGGFRVIDADIYLKSFSKCNYALCNDLCGAARWLNG